MEYSPGVAPRHHRTNSIDYAVVLSGSIELQLDTETVPLNPGDVLVQRGTMHNWMNHGTEPCVIAFILIGDPLAYALQLTSEHSVDATLYGKAESAFGRQGLVDITLLVGRYLTISALLNGFEIPRP